MSNHAWNFTNSLGRVITTRNPVDAEKYRHDPAFTEVTDTAAEQVDDTEHVLPYEDAAWTRKKLEAEIEARNDAAGDGEHRISVEASANRTQLVAALQADDVRRAELTGS